MAAIGEKFGAWGASRSAAAATIMATSTVGLSLSMECSLNVILSRQRQVAKAEGPTRDPLADGNVEGLSEVRAVEDEGVEFAVLATRVDAGGQVRQQIGVDGPAGERGVELGGVYADNHGLESGRDELADEGAGLSAPDRIEGVHPVFRHHAVAIGADVLQIQVAEGHRLDAPNPRLDQR